jgi:predicted transcriptional regulator
MMSFAPPIQNPTLRFGDSVVSLLRAKSGDTWTVSPDATVFEAVEQMSHRQVGALPVVEGTELVGMISERDYARKVILQGRNSRDTQVREIMSGDVHWVTPQHTVDDCMRLMTTSRVRHLPVLENGRIVGILSIGDLVNWIISSQEATILHLHNYISGSYPG